MINIRKRGDYLTFPKSRKLLPAEIGRNLTPFFCLPFNEGIPEAMCFEPLFGTCHYLIEIFRLGGAFEGGLAFLLIHPQDGIIAVRIYCLCAVSLLFEKGKRMNYGKKLTNIICAMDGAEMECPTEPWHS